MWNDKVAIITGGASGIGRALAEALVARGAHVRIADVSPTVHDVAKTIGATGVELDVCDADAVRALMHTTAVERGRLDVLFNNAGITIAGTALDLDDTQFNRVLDVNLRGVLNGVRAAYPIMVKQGFGHIVNTGSLAGLLPMPLQLPYAVSKFAVVGMSLALRSEAAAHGVRVSVVCPGVIDTPILRTTPAVGFDRAALFANMPRGAPVDACARAILRGVERDRAIIVVTALARVAWMLWRVSPSLATLVVAAVERELRRRIAAHGSSA